MVFTEPSGEAHYRDQWDGAWLEAAQGFLGEEAALGPPHIWGQETIRQAYPGLVLVKLLLHAEGRGRVQQRNLRR